MEHFNKQTPCLEYSEVKYPEFYNKLSKQNRHREWLQSSIDSSHGLCEQLEQTAALYWIYKLYVKLKIEKLIFFIFFYSFGGLWYYFKIALID